MIGKEIVAEEGRCGHNKRGSKRWKGSKRKQREEVGISFNDQDRMLIWDLKKQKM